MLHRIRSLVARNTRIYKLTSSNSYSFKEMSIVDHERAGAGERRLEDLQFDNQSLRELPVDPIRENYVRSVENACFSMVDPTPVTSPVLVAVSLPALQLIDIPASETVRPDFAEYFSGNIKIPGSTTAAHCYCGHQFGSFAGQVWQHVIPRRHEIVLASYYNVQLGDGATMYIGEIINSSGERIEIQFKGAGKTPYSRTADGRKVLRSSIREFLCSELMHSLGIPTTRAGTLVTSDTLVERDMFYTGDVIKERASVITRLASTFIRFGSFEIFKSMDTHTGRVGPSVGNVALLQQMLDFVCKRHYPSIQASFPTSAAPRNLAMYEEIVRRSARLAACWQAYGWQVGGTCR
jgi:uncharacterized protein YdiU (UPF0061 family)